MNKAETGLRKKKHSWFGGGGFLYTINAGQITKQVMYIHYPNVKTTQK